MAQTLGSAADLDDLSLSSQGLQEVIGFPCLAQLHALLGRCARLGLRRRCVGPVSMFGVYSVLHEHTVNFLWWLWRGTDKDMQILSLHVVVCANP